MNKTNEQRGFTLVEMLVVIAILGILMAMMIPAAGMILKRAKVASTKGDAGVVAATMMKYRMEYNRWPSWTTSGLPEGYPTDKKWVETMCPPAGSPRSPDNFNMILFFEPGGGALAPATSAFAGAFVDPWGNPYRFCVDADGDGQIQSPDLNSTKLIQAQVIAWSAGSDGDYATFPNDEKVESWER